jgi:hypothetical protein
MMNHVLPGTIARHNADRAGADQNPLFTARPPEVFAGGALVELDLLLSRPRLGSAFRFERFCYTLPSLTYLGTPATAGWQD